MKRRTATIRKSDLTPAFEAAKAAGYDHLSIVVETADGHKFTITAGVGTETAQLPMSKLEQWKAGRATS